MSFLEDLGVAVESTQYIFTRETLIQQELAVRVFVLLQGMENAGILDVFPIYHTEVREQKIHPPAADELLRFS